MTHLCWNCYLGDSFDVWTLEHSWDLVLSCLFLEIAITVRDILYLQELIREILDPWNTFYHVGDLKLVTILRCWWLNFDVGAIFWMSGPSAYVTRKWMLVTKMSKKVTVNNMMLATSVTNMTPSLQTLKPSCSLICKWKLFKIQQRGIQGLTLASKLLAISI